MGQWMGAGERRAPWGVAGQLLGAQLVTSGGSTCQCFQAGCEISTLGLDWGSAGCMPRGCAALCAVLWIVKDMPLLLLLLLCLHWLPVSPIALRCQFS